MRDNRVKDRLLQGEAVFGTMVFEFVAPGLPAVLAGAGAEFVIYDMEHSGISEAEFKRQVSYCRGLSIVPMVRPPEKTYAATARLLDVGAMGLIFQMVESKSEAEDIVSWTRYPPEGVRGAMFGGAHDDYAGGEVADKMAAANARTLVMALIETARGVEQVDEILSVPGIDVAHIGHFDLSLTMGIPGKFDHPDFVAAIDTVLAACRKHEKPAGFLAPNVDWGRAWMARGFRMVSYSYDIGLLGGALSAGISALKGTN
ncbi:MAG TPA: aldolase/citrate lyase family protein [Alphaproteobacteria bacterium]